LVPALSIWKKSGVLVGWRDSVFAKQPFNTWKLEDCVGLFVILRRRRRIDQSKTQGEVPSVVPEVLLRARLRLSHLRCRRLDNCRTIDTHDEDFVTPQNLILIS
jgi:hypothetical protein